ncbi:MAG: PrsW family glutamic-type intramembrane protease [Termitinemataceae bacterium]
MDPLVYVLLLVGIALGPVASVYLVIHHQHKDLDGIVFLSMLVSGILSLFGASLSLAILPRMEDARWISLVYTIFIRNALSEEIWRLLIAFLWFKFMFFSEGKGLLQRQKEIPLKLDRTSVVLMGMTTGFSFAALETLGYALTQGSLVFIRTLTAAPLHAACGSRVALAAATLFPRTFPCTDGPWRQSGLSLFIQAVLIHGAYNLFLVLPGPSPVIAIGIGILAFTSIIIQSEIIKKKI